MPISTIGSNSLNQTSDLTINGQTVGKGGGNVATNTAHGVSALQANTTGANQTVVGYQAGYTNTTGGNFTAFGGQAAYTYNSTTENWGSTFIGFRSGQYTTSGNDNAFVGGFSGRNNITGSYNVSLGASSLYSNTTASNNTAVGYQALYSNQTGTRNNAVGYKAGYAMTGNDITAFGDQAGLNTTGNLNTSIGSAALFNNTTGAENTVLGAGAMFGSAGTSTGSYNTAIGRQALGNNTTGTNNVCVGYQAGNGTTTESNNVYIGYQCGSGATGGGNVFFGASTFTGYSGNNQVACKVGNGREAFYADINAGASFRQYSNSSTWATTSDQRVKENIVEITNGLEKIVALRPVTFDYITSKEHNAGFIAQDFQTVLPDQVKKVKARPEEAELVGEDEIYSIQQNLVPYLVNAIKELKALVDAQATEIAELKAKVAP